MSLLVVGLSHRTAPVELREAVDFGRGGLDRALNALASRGIGAEMVVLSTCNRAEAYVVSEAATAAEQIAHFFGDYHSLERSALARHLYLHNGVDAARHLFCVAAGLDSLVVGEPQILGQVKAAYQAAHQQHFTGPITNRLFHAAFSAGKRVRSETGIGDGAVSVSYAAIGLARKIFSSLEELNVLILGAGEMAKLTGVHLNEHRVRPLTIVSRTLSAAENLARQLNGRAVPWSLLDAALAGADILVTATGAAETVLSRARLAKIMQPRRHRSLFIIDIAVPRDVEPAAGQLGQVFLYNIDDLQGIVRENLARRSAELARAETIITEEVTRFASWLQSREVLPTVVALRQRFEAIRLAELERLAPKLAGLPPEARARVEDVTRLIVEKLLVDPTQQLKSVTDESLIVSYADALNRLFNLTTADKSGRIPEASESKVRTP